VRRLPLRQQQPPNHCVCDLDIVDDHFRVRHRAIHEEEEDEAERDEYAGGDEFQGGPCTRSGADGCEGAVGDGSGGEGARDSIADLPAGAAANLSVVEASPSNLCDKVGSKIAVDIWFERLRRHTC
jgi:hypothetical protein